MISRLILPVNLYPSSLKPYQCVSQVPPHISTLRFARLFSTTSSRYDSFINHYEVLKLPQDCSPAELKKRFYALSRQTHPDVNRTDPDAPARFSQISESYSILADPGRRKRYDRDVLRLHQQSPGQWTTTPGGRAGGGAGSYAGSRPASGLSKRRGTFRGPPPSFYAHGGRYDPPQHPDNTNTTSGGASSATDHPSPQSRTNFTPPPNTDFNPHPIHRTQTHEDMRRQTRRQAAMAAAQKDMDEDAGFWVRFMIATGLLVAGVSLAGILLGLGGTTSVRKGGLTRGDGSRREVH